MKKIFILLLGFYFIPIFLNSQSDSGALYKMRDRLLEEIKPNNRLVYEYTFRHLFKNDFSAITTGDKENLVIGKYAALDLNSETKKVTFSPFVWVLGNPRHSPFHHIFNAELTGAVNSDNMFSFKDKTSASISINYTYVSGGYNFYPNEKRKINYIELYKCKAEEVIKENEGNCVFKKLDSGEMLDAYLEKVRLEEEKLTQSSWTSKSIWWIKFNANLLSFDNFDYYYKGDTATIVSPASMSVYNPSILGSYNWLKLYLNKTKLYFNLWGKFALKNTLSEISSSETWNKLQPFNDSINFSVESRELYSLNQDEFTTLPVFDFGGQVISIFNFKPIEFGIDLKLSKLDFIRPGTKTFTSSKVDFLIGIIFPFKDSKGATSINKEPFYQYSWYYEYEAGSSKSFGIRFGLPFHNIF